jgi:pyruvate,water dikinase
MKTILWAEEVDKTSIPEVGGKGANLGEMIQNEFPIPEAFIVTADAFEHFVTSAGIRDDLMDILSKVDVNNEKNLTETSKSVREIVRGARIPWNLEIDIIGAYKKLSSKSGTIEDSVAVRSSATAEDLPEASFAGQQETYLNVHTKGDLLEKVKECWGSLYTPRAIFYRETQGFKHADVKLAVVVQRMVNSDVSGVMFSSDPSTGAPEVLIEAGYGLGEAIVGGEITPDTYKIRQKNLEIMDKHIGKQTWKYTRDEKGDNIKLDVDKKLQKKQKIRDDQIVKIAEIGIGIEEHYEQPMDIEWAIENEEIYIVQARPVTTIKKEGKKSEKKAESEEKEEEEKMEASGSGKTLVSGLPASPGIASGKVVRIDEISELDKVKEGDIMVTGMTNPDMVPAMKRAAGIVTDEGGMTCHAAIVSRELGVPCIVGTTDATEILKEGMEVTVDGKVGVVMEGITEQAVKAKTAEAAPVGAVAADVVPVTGTKVYMNLGVPEMADKYSALPAQGIGLMREEFIFTSNIGEHPVDLIKKGEQQKVIDALADSFATVCRAMYPRPVVLRTSDFKTNEYRDLKGGEAYEPEESNPMIGWRGCSRYISPDFEEAFRLELRAIKKVREEMNLKNLWIMLPFVRAVWEFKKIIGIMKDEGIERGPDFKLWIMAEVPSNIFLADEFAKYCDGFSIGSNDLTQLVMGADRDSEILGNMGYFDERNDAVKRAIAQLIKVAHENGCTVSICGQAPSVYPEFTEFLIREGIDSISLNPDTVVATTKLVAQIEQRILLERMKEQAEK